MIFRTEHGDLTIQQPPMQVSPGDRLKAVIRPESIGIARPGHQTDAGKNVIEGCVVSNMYIGSLIRYTIALGDRIFYVDEADPQYCGILQKGDKAQLILKDRIHMLKE